MTANISVGEYLQGSGGSWCRFSTETYNASEEGLETLLDHVRDRLYDARSRDSYESVSKQSMVSSPSFQALSSSFRSLYADLPSLSEGNLMEKCGRGRVLRFLASDLSPIEATIVSNARKLLAEDESRPLLKAQLTFALQDACSPGYERLFKVLLEENSREGLHFLVSLRQDLLLLLQLLSRSRGNAGIGSEPAESEEHDVAVARFKQLDSHLKGLLSTWFSKETLEIRRVTYESTSAATIEKIATKEAVHPLRSLDDLKQRLGPDRRVFAAFHPLIPGEPLVFVHAAMRSSISTSMNEVLETPSDEDSKKENTTTAVFYSISSTQPGLAGIDLGQVLLTKAMRTLKEEFPALETFVTLSPIPRFRKWLQEKLAINIDAHGHFADDNFLSQGEVEKLAECLGCPKEKALETLLRALDAPQHLMETHSIPLKPLVMKLAASYLVNQKYRRKPLDGVARFHLRNGAEMFQLNFAADNSRKGIHNSLGVMVNYRYCTSQLDENQRRYEIDNHVFVLEGVSKHLSSIVGK